MTDDRIRFADAMARACQAASAIGYENAQIIVVDKRKVMNAAARDGWQLAAQPTPRADVVPGKVHCAVCGFTLLRTNLYVNSGTTGPGDERCEPCPNDGNPLLPMTWEQEAREASSMAEQMFDRAKAAEDVLAFAAQHLGSDWPLRCQEIVRRARRVFPPPDQADHVPDAGKMVGDIGSPHNACMHKGYCLTLKAAQEQAEPVAFQARFVENGDSGWAPCSREHYELVTANPADWRGYECRMLYCYPPAAQQSDPLTREQIDYSLKAGDAVVNRRWKLTSLEVIDINWALRAAAVRLGPGGRIVVWPVSSLRRVHGSTKEGGAA